MPTAHSLFSTGMVLQRNAQVPVWGETTPGQPVTVAIQNQVQTAITGDDGRWAVVFEPLDVGGPYTMTICDHDAEIVVRDVLVGEVWLCSGQCNMAMTLARGDRYWCGVMNEAAEVSAACYPRIRSFKVPVAMSAVPQTQVAGRWFVCSPQTVGTFSAIGYFFARELYRELGLPIGIITSAYGASTAEAWMGRPALQATARLRHLDAAYEDRIRCYNPAGVEATRYKAAARIWRIRATEAKARGLDQPKHPKNPDPTQDQHNPGTLYHGMIAPLAPFAVRGVLWYQGESNCPTASLYGALLQALILDWRARWNLPEMPFLIVQLPNYRGRAESPPGRSTWALIREGQLRGLSILKTGLAVTIDLGEADNIHAKRKEEVGYRLSLAARALVYHHPIPFSGPLFRSMKKDGSRLHLEFDHAETGLRVPASFLEGFAIAGEDRKFVWGNASIEGRIVTVSQSAIEHPMAVRYGWADNPPANLYNGAGLPASPFRTDDW